ncbi:MAG: alpha/beta fold hydrolase [Bdellovibrionota bacterium]
MSPMKNVVEVEISSGDLTLPGIITNGRPDVGWVVFAHGSGSSRLSPRNQQVASGLNKAGLGTLLFDLLTEDESSDRDNVFDIPLLASRLSIATEWLWKRAEANGMPTGFFGASTGAAAALLAAANIGERISAVVSRGGRPDLVMDDLPRVPAPTLLIVGEDDDLVLGLNKKALSNIPNGQILVIPGASHLFEEPGKLEEVTAHASNWFWRHFQEHKTRKTVSA